MRGKAGEMRGKGGEAKENGGGRAQGKWGRKVGGITKKFLRAGTMGETSTSGSRKSRAEKKIGGK